MWLLVWLLSQHYQHYHQHAHTWIHTWSHEAPSGIGTSKTASDPNSEEKMELLELGHIIYIYIYIFLDTYQVNCEKKTQQFIAISAKSSLLLTR